MTEDRLSPSAGEVSVQEEGRQLSPEELSAQLEAGMQSILGTIRNFSDEEVSEFKKSVDLLSKLESKPMFAFQYEKFLDGEIAPKFFEDFIKLLNIEHSEENLHYFMKNIFPSLSFYKKEIWSTVYLENLQEFSISMERFLKIAVLYSQIRGEGEFFVFFRQALKKEGVLVNEDRGKKGFKKSIKNGDGESARIFLRDLGEEGIDESVLKKEIEKGLKITSKNADGESFKIFLEMAQEFEVEVDEKFLFDFVREGLQITSNNGNGVAFKCFTESIDLLPDGDEKNSLMRQVKEGILNQKEVKLIDRLKGNFGINVPLGIRTAMNQGDGKSFKAFVEVITKFGIDDETLAKILVAIEKKENEVFGALNIDPKQETELGLNAFFVRNLGRMAKDGKGEDFKEAFLVACEKFDHQTSFFELRGNISISAKNGDTKSFLAFLAVSKEVGIQMGKEFLQKQIFELLNSGGVVSAKLLEIIKSNFPGFNLLSLLDGGHRKEAFLNINNRVNAQNSIGGNVKEMQGRVGEIMEFIGTTGEGGTEIKGSEEIFYGKVLADALKKEFGEEKGRKILKIIADLLEKKESNEQRIEELESILEGVKKIIEKVQVIIQSGISGCAGNFLDEVLEILKNAGVEGVEVESSGGLSGTYI